MKKKFKTPIYWKEVDSNKYQYHITISSNTESVEETDERVVYIQDLEKRKEAYGTCKECNEPGTGEFWCQSCNANRFKDNFKNWTSGNKDVDELIQKSQLDAVYYKKCLEWVPFENFQDVTYVAKGGFGKIYSAIWPEGYIYYWNIKEQKWKRETNRYVALKSLENSSDISRNFLNEIKSHLQIYIYDIIPCYGITQDPKTKDYMMILKYCKGGNLRNYLNGSENYVNCKLKINHLSQIVKGLLNIHNAGKVHKDFHSGNILFNYAPYISDLGMCQPANNEEKSFKKDGIYGVLPYIAPEVLRGYQYTKASDIYSFGIVMNEFVSEEIPYSNIPHDLNLAIKICKGLRPKIFEDTPKLLADLIMKCWDAKAENRPTAKELYQILNKWNDEIENNNNNSEICFQIKKCDDIREGKLKDGLSKNNLKSIQIQKHPQAIYASRLLNFKNLPDPVNSSNFSDAFSSISANPISECLDCQLSESDLNEIN